MSGLTIDTEVTDGVTVISLAGELDLNNATGLKKLLEKLNEEDKNQILINCSKLNYIDSSGLGILIRTKANFTANKKDKIEDVVLYDLSEEVEKVIELTKLSNFFTVKTDKQSGIDYFKS